MITKNQAIDLIKKTLIETVGCTEPIAIALATATAYNQIKGEIVSINVTLDKNVYKNAFSIIVPGTDKRGIKYTVALATTNVDEKKGLLLFENINKKNIEKADNLNLNLIKLNYDTTHTSLYINVEIITSEGTASCLIKDLHNNITLIKKNDKTVINQNHKKSKKQTNKLKNFTINEILNILDEISEEEINFLSKYVDINLNAVKKGLKQNSKKNIGVALKQILNKNSILDKIKYHVAAAASLRMAGEKIQIIGCAGSGNQGITFFITTGLAYKYLNKNNKISINKALALGLLVLIFIKNKTGLLNPMCGCSVAAAAACAGAITYFLNGNSKKILSAINLVLASLAGLICDGAKLSCSLKISTSVSVALESALLAKNGLSICGEGITDNCLISSIKNLSTLHNIGMQKMDETILKIFSKKKNSSFKYETCNK